jgi:hypothetical protein
MLHSIILTFTGVLIGRRARGGGLRGFKLLFLINLMVHHIGAGPKSRGR